MARARQGPTVHLARRQQPSFRALPEHIACQASPCCRRRSVLLVTIARSDSPCRPAMARAREARTALLARRLRWAPDRVPCATCANQVRTARSATRVFIVQQARRPPLRALRARTALTMAFRRRVAFAVRASTVLQVPFWRQRTLVRRAHTVRRARRVRHLDLWICISPCICFASFPPQAHITS
jgi:hypothetical protein